VVTPPLAGHFAAFFPVLLTASRICSGGYAAFFSRLTLHFFPAAGG